MEWWNGLEWNGGMDWNGIVEWNSTLVISIGGHLFIKTTFNKDHLFIKTILLLMFKVLLSCFRV